MTTQEIFAADQILTVAKAIQLKGKQIACTSAEYKANQPRVKTFIVGEIISEWDNAANEAYPDQHGKHTQYENFQQYWASYMTETQIKDRKARLILLSEDGKRQYIAITNSGFYSVPVFTGSDADREVYFVEL